MLASSPVSSPGHPVPQPRPLLLALDTATETMHLALRCGPQVLVHEAVGGVAASAGLIPAVQALLAQAGIGLAQLDAIAFGRGPGAFTGLRTAASVTQGLAFGADKPVIALDTLLATAQDAKDAGADPRRIDVVHDARMGEVYAAAYAWDGRTWQTVRPVALMSPQQWLDALAQPQPPSALAGNALHALPDLQAAAQASGIPLWPQAAPRGLALAELAHLAWLAADLLPAEQALPLYVRDKVALTTSERQMKNVSMSAAATPPVPRPLS